VFDLQYEFQYKILNTGMNLELLDEVVEALGPEPERSALEAVLLFLVSEGKMSVSRAGEILHLDRISAISWYTSHGFYYPDLSEEDLDEELRHARKP
jgi:hypothetical protein